MIRCKCRTSHVNPTIFGVKLDEKRRIVHYADTHETSDDVDIIHLSDTKEVPLKPGEVKKLKELLDFNWAKVTVLHPNCRYEKLTEDHTYRTHFRIYSGDYERWHAHRLGPNGIGRQFDSRWRQVEEVIEGAIRRKG